MIKIIKRSAVKFLVSIFKRYNPKFLVGSAAFCKFRDRVFYSDVYSTSYLADVQKKDTIEILRIIFEYFKSPRDIVLLDVGCNARMARYFAGYVKRVVGINVYENDIKAASCPKNVELLVMSAVDLKFNDKTFDFIFSSNVYEHLPEFSRCIDEQLRVLKDGGYCYAIWEPVWSSGKGHHIHPDMVQDWENYHKSESSNYKNNGIFIKDWAHLLLSKEEMLEHLLVNIKSKKVADQIVRYIYEENDLNRNSFDDVQRIFSEKNMRIVFWERQKTDPSAEVLQSLKNKYGDGDFSTRGSRVLFTPMI